MALNNDFSPIHKKTVLKSFIYKSKSPMKKIEIQSEVCNVCKKSVFQVEEIKLDNLTVHKWCFKCSDCNKVLDIGQIATQNENLYCHICFKKKYATKGYDFGQGALELELKDARGMQKIDTIAPKINKQEDFRAVPLKNISVNKGITKK